ncbi:MAG TPA: hypothetical protein VNG29_01230 [Candidatus Paceibacterota bacterium]|nr:hypothetical protein [Candidatus Paceibacterota bacterium]
MNEHYEERILKIGAVVCAVLAALALSVWRDVSAGAPDASPRDYFLDVGQGDSELIVFHGNVKVMTDAGPDTSVLASLARVMPPGDRYIDVAIISHPQLDHFNGFNFILDHYAIGAFIVNGRDNTATAHQWSELLAKIKAHKIPLIVFGAGDRIRYGDDEIDILSPDGQFAQSAELADTGLVELVKTPEFQTLLAADIGSKVEEYLVAHGSDLRADVLKVGHHGSKTSSEVGFLAAVGAKVAVIEAGAHNMYSYPAKETLSRLAAAGANIFRTDQNGTVEISANGRALDVFSENRLPDKLSQ